MKATARYRALCFQTNIHVVDESNLDPAHFEAQIRKNLARQCELIDWAFLDPYVGPKLIAFSEFCLVGIPESRVIGDYLKRAVYLPGWVSEVLGAKAKEYDCYIAAHVFEKDDAFPGFAFNTAFIVGPDGQIALKYRKNNNTQSGRAKNMNPGDIYDDYIRINGGPESLFPVIDTPIGRLGMFTCFDVRFPEVARCLALRGAEVLVHLSSENQQCRGVWTTSKQVRAWDNQVYIVSGNNGLLFDTKHPSDGECGLARIIDFEGRVLAESAGTGESFIQAQIDLEALRSARARARSNVLATNRFWMYLPSFENPDKQAWPLSSFSVANPYTQPRQIDAVGEAVFEKLYRRGTFVRPEAEFAPNGRRYLSQYEVVCLQTNVHAVANHQLTQQQIDAHTRSAIERNLELIDYVCDDPDHDPKLICLSATHLTGVPDSRRLEDYQALAVEVPGWITTEYGRKAKEYGLYIVAGVLERDPSWPERVFNSAFLISPDGDVVLRYRKNNGAQMGRTVTTDPGDIYDAYAERYGGTDAFFPVADTELGRIGLMLSDDLRMAEVARMLALNGAEVIVHPTTDPAGGGASGDSWQLAKRVRAWDNTVYFVSVNNGLTLGSRRPASQQRAHATQIVDFLGQVLAEDQNEGESYISATVDLAALRRLRTNRTRNVVPLATSRYGMYAPIYRAFEGWPKNAFAERPPTSAQEAVAVAEASLDRLYRKGVMIPPVVAQPTIRI